MAWTTPRTWATSEVVTASIMNTHVRDNLDYLHGARTSWTPQIDQGASTNIAKTVTVGTYIRVGDVVHAWCRLALTAAGTAASAVTITLPVTSITASIPAGHAAIYDSSGAVIYTGVPYLTTTTQASFLTDGSNANGWGSNPNLALASGDVIYAQLTYPVV